MAHRLAGKRNRREAEISSNDSADIRDKDLLNRREYVKLGTIATATVIGTGAGMVAASSDEDGSVNTFTTDFEEYVL